MARRSDPGTNLLDCTPRHAITWEPGGDGRVVLLVPRFRTGPLARWLQPRLSRPVMRVRLDERGSWVWQRCDGTSTVGAIAGAMAAAYEEGADAATDRVARFVQTLVRDRFVTLDLPGGS